MIMYQFKPEILTTQTKIRYGRVKCILFIIIIYTFIRELRCVKRKVECQEENLRVEEDYKNKNELGMNGRKLLRISKLTLGVDARK